MEATVHLQIPKPEVEAFCRRHHIRRLSLFGSVLRDDFGPDSDVDVLVEFEATKRVGLMGLAAMERELGELLGRKVDLNTPGFFREPARKKVSQQASVQYVAS